MRAGGIYHRVSFYEKVITRDEFNSSVDSWPVATIQTRGEVRWSGGNFAITNDEKTYHRNMELTVRYRSGIDENMKVQIDNTTDCYIITYIEMLGRKEGLRLTLEKLNNEMVVNQLGYTYLYDTTMLLDGTSLR